MTDKSIGDIDIVSEVIQRLDGKTRKRMLESAVAKMLQDTVGRKLNLRDGDVAQHTIKEAADALFHKAQSLMSSEEAHKWTAEMQSIYGVDARRNTTVRGPRRKVQDFIPML